MPKPHKPRSGSMQYWPRKRAKRHYARVRSWPESKEAKPLGFAGYKVGMRQAVVNDTRAHSLTKGEEISVPVTIIECPPVKVAGVAFYKHSQKISSILSDKPDKVLARKICLPKKTTKKFDDVKDYDDIRLLIHTQPKLTGIGRKKPEVFELALGGKLEEKVAFAKEKLGKEIAVSEVFADGQQLDVHAITKGKGYQGPVKRFGIGLRQHKSEKTKRGPGSLGGWKSQGHVMYRVPFAGKMGCHQRTHNNLWLMKIVNEPKEVNIAAGYPHYGNVKTECLVVKGSIPGSQNHILTLSAPMRPNKKIPTNAPEIVQMV